MARANHLCGATGSPFGPFAMQTYEAADYRNAYARAMELAGYNQLFPEYPSFAVPDLETGDRGAGSSHLVPGYIPPVLLKAIGWIESGWAQASYDPLVNYGEVGPTLISHDCGYGIMQITSGMQNVAGVPNLDQAMIGGHYAFNIARGSHILADKWNHAPEFRPIVGNRDPHVIENWYFALWGYNGFAFKNHPLNPAYDPARPQYSCGPDGDGFGHSRGAYPYQDLVLGCAAHPPIIGGLPLWTPVEVHLPNLADPAFAGPLATTNWEPCSYSLICAPLDIPTPNPSHADPAVPPLTRAQALGSPRLGIWPTALELDTTPGGETFSKSVGIYNVGSGVLAWRASSAASWLKVSVDQGVSTGPELGDVHATISMYGDARDLPPGNHTTALRVESLYSDWAPFSITVTVRVSLQEGVRQSGDFNDDGKDDLAFLCCSDYASIWMSQWPSSFTTSTFRPWAGYGVTAGQWVAGDVTGDGRTDLIHLCCEGYANIWISRGDGTFDVRFFQPWEHYTLQAGTWQTGDFNGDGRTDLMHLCCADYAQTWLSNGDGTFGLVSTRAWPDYSMTSGPWKSLDLNGDQRTDLVHLCCRDYANAWISLGNGAFGVTTVEPWPDYSVQIGEWHTGDFNGDGKGDLLHLCCQDYAQLWQSMGNGAFSVQFVQPWPGYTMNAGEWKVLDLNGDGRTDLVHVCCPDYVNSWLSYGGGLFGVTSFRPWPDYAIGVGAWENGDWNGDGGTDLMHICCHYVHTWRSIGDGTYVVDTYTP